MLSTHKSVTSRFGKLVAVAMVSLLTACGATGPRSSGDVAAIDLSQPVRVALLVPMGTGDPGRDNIGRNMVNAAQLAQADLSNVAIDLQVYETGGSEVGGASAASQAIAEGASIIVGPLFSTATAGASGHAAAANIKVLSLSNNAEVAGGNVYILGNTFQNTADRLVAYGLSRGLQNFGVIYPFGLEGETARDAVAVAVNRRGGELVASEGYNLSHSGIQSAAAPAAAALNARGANAVILTDGPTGGLGLISEELRSNGVSAANAQFLGMQRWDISQEALSLSSLQGGAFAANDPGPMAAFQGRYQNAYGQPPHELAGLAYDGVAAVGALIAQAKAGGGNSNPFSDSSLTQNAGFAGVNGPFRLLPGGMNQRSLAIFEVRGGQSVVVQPAARGFESFAN